MVEEMRGTTERVSLCVSVCVCTYPDGELEAVVLLLQPVCHTPGQTHGALSITCTYAVASISHMEVHAKSARCSRVFSLFSVMNHILLNKQNTRYASVLTSYARGLLDSHQFRSTRGCEKDSLQRSFIPFCINVR